VKEEGIVKVVSIAALSATVRMFPMLVASFTHILAE